VEVDGGINDGLHRYYRLRCGYVAVTIFGKSNALPCHYSGRLFNFFRQKDRISDKIPDMGEIRPKQIK
jgi:hypothetical protein